MKHDTALRTLLHTGSLLLAPLALAAPRLALPQEGLRPMHDRRTAVVDVIENARPAVVSIDATNRVRGAWGVFDLPVSGTGVVIYEDGTIVTNYHVVEAQEGTLAQEILVRFDEADDETVYQGRVISAVKAEDLALVKIEGPAPFPTIAMSDDEPLLGETVVAIGNAVGQTHTVSTGIISGLHRNLSVPERALHFESLLQTDAAINPGNSGGPLLDINGQLVGINTAISRGAENIGFAIPVARVRSVLANQLLSLDQARSYLGYEVADEGFLVTKVAPLGPAALAGLAVGDRLLEIDGKAIQDQEVYGRSILSAEPGRRLELVVNRGGRRERLGIEPWTQVEGAIHDRLGVSVRRIVLGRSITPYLQLTSVDPDGPAGRIGLQEGDLIAALRPEGYRSHLVRSSRELAILVHRLDPGTQVEIEVWRDDNGNGRYERTNDASELYSGSLRLR